jgi:hypothetical protein
MDRPPGFVVERPGPIIDIGGLDWYPDGPGINFLTVARAAIAVRCRRWARS